MSPVRLGHVDAWVESPPQIACVGSNASTNPIAAIFDERALQFVARRELVGTLLGERRQLRREFHIMMRGGSGCAGDGRRFLRRHVFLMRRGIDRQCRNNVMHLLQQRIVFFETSCRRGRCFCGVP